MGHFVVNAAVNVRVPVGENIKQPAGRGEYRSDIYIGSGHYVVVADVMGGWIVSYVFIFILGLGAAAAAAAHKITTEAERDAQDVYCCCCSWLLLFLSFRLRCFGYGC